MFVIMKVRKNCDTTKSLIPTDIDELCSKKCDITLFLQ